jgi:hypothetical protein
MHNTLALVDRGSYFVLPGKALRPRRREHCGEGRSYRSGAPQSPPEQELMFGDPPARLARKVVNPTLTDLRAADRAHALLEYAKDPTAGSHMLRIASPVQ